MHVLFTKRDKISITSQEDGYGSCRFKKSHYNFFSTTDYPKDPCILQSNLSSGARLMKSCLLLACLNKHERILKIILSYIYNNKDTRNPKLSCKMWQSKNDSSSLSSVVLSKDRKTMLYNFQKEKIRTRFTPRISDVFFSSCLFTCILCVSITVNTIIY